MLSRDFDNGKKVNLQSAMAAFTVIMGFLFLIDAAPGVHTVIAGSFVLFGFAWFFTNQAWQWWEHQHH